VGILLVLRWHQISIVVTLFHALKILFSIGYLFGYNLRFYKTKSTKKRAKIGHFLVSKETRWRKSV